MMMSEVEIEDIDERVCECTGIRLVCKLAMLLERTWGLILEWLQSVCMWNIHRANRAYNLFRCGYEYQKTYQIYDEI